VLIDVVLECKNEEKQMAEQGIVKAFEFEGNQVRVEVFEGEPWWAAKDVALALGYPENTVASSMTNLVEKVPEEWRGKKSFLTPGGAHEIIALSEQGLYLFMNRSNMEKAIPFQKWIAGEVLPSIRRTGSYTAPGVVPVDFCDPRAAALAFVEQYDRAMAAETQVQRLEQYRERSAPFVSFAASVMDSPTTYCVGQVAKSIFQGTHKRLGQNMFFAWLREQGFLHKAGAQRNEPTQRGLQHGLLVVVEHARETEEGRVMIDRTTRITGKGRLYFYGRFYIFAVLEGLNPDPQPPVIDVEEEILDEALLHAGEAEALDA
jgi:anti-repressor protein